MKAVKTKLQETNPDRVNQFEKDAQAFAKKVIEKFKDYEFVSCPQPAEGILTHAPRQYTGESMNPDGMVALLNYRVSGSHIQDGTRTNYFDTEQEDGMTRKCLKQQQV